MGRSDVLLKAERTMHQIEPYHNWQKYYDSTLDDRLPFYGKEYNYELYTDTIYGYYIDPAWDSIGSETLYVKVLYTDYTLGFTVIEIIGEWNDAINNDIMTLKRNLIEFFLKEGITKFILIGDDSYYEEWFEEVEDGWIAAVSFPDFVMEEMQRFRLDQYINMGGTLQIDNWRTMLPLNFFDIVEKLIQRRLN
jgi:hypothetical protein